MLLVQHRSIGSQFLGIARIVEEGLNDLVDVLILMRDRNPLAKYVKCLDLDAAPDKRILEVHQPGQVGDLPQAIAAEFTLGLLTQSHPAIVEQRHLQLGEALGQQLEIPFSLIRHRCPFR